MSEGTSCNYCSLQRIREQYGHDNVRWVPARRSELGGLDVQVREPGQDWQDEPVAWFMVLTAHCVC